MSTNTAWFTPEYSSELLRLVEDIYENDIKPHYAVLKLEELNDLMDHTKYLYDSFSEEMKNRNKQDALAAYIIGCYFLYLIIPQSTQFQARNKTFHVRNALKKLYENQVNMTNVLLMVKDEIDSILDRDLRKLKGVERTRAFSSPDNDVSSKISRLTLAENESILPKLKNKSEFVRSDGNLHAHDTENIPLWSAPSLEPNDQLKLALDSAVLSSSSVDTVDRESPELSLSPIEYPEHKSKSELTVEENECPQEDHRRHDQQREGHFWAQQYDVDDSNEQHFWDAKVDRAVAHRKDSYHSVYMDDGDHDFGNYDENKEVAFPQSEVQAIKRMQKQSIITSPELFSILSNQNERSRLLLIDLRLQSRYKFNSILGPNMVFIDPRLLWDSDSKTPVTDISVLEGKLKSSIFNNRGSFDFIVYYTDMKTYMDMDFDYLFVFYNLVVTAQDAPIRSLPSYLLGGYEKWKTVLKKYLTQFGIRVDDYLYRPYADNKEGTEKSANAKPIEPVPWKPPALPERMRNLPLPPSPASLPITKEIPPPIPPKIQLEKQERIEHERPRSHTVGSTVGTTKDVVVPEQLSQLESIPMRQRQFSVPTIERSSNKYVALSITGLRNLGSTCYVNSMVQCLFATNMFRDLFEPSKYERFFNRELEDSGKLSNSFSVLIRKMYMNGGCSVVPTSFLKVCNYLRPDFNIPDEQQDAQEFLMLAIDRLHDELSNQNEVLNAYPELVLYDDTGLKVQKEEYKQWFENSLMKSKFSPIDKIFQGQLENGLHCKRCGYSSYSYSTFYILSLAIPKPSSNFMSSNKGNRVNLEDCINMFTNDEVMSGENAWDCPKCGVTAQKEKSESSRNQSHKHRHSIGSAGSPEPRKVKKKDEEGTSLKSKTKSLLFPKKNKSSSSKSLSPFNLLNPSSSNSSTNNNGNNGSGSKKNAFAIRATNFVTLPPVLVIHLSRFYYDLTKKNETVITYPLILNIVLKNNDTLKYRLYGVVNHNGNLISGHYTSLVNKNRDHDLENNYQQWYYFDDEVVKHETNHGNLFQGVNKVSSKDVYVLFYERID
ncbi:hypothetical protein ZYGR_0AG07010 [Zygosaccharomyces rouxii]|uniref:ubiquitinyl hydrolase 1 n=1 Tax=Zygosaccharomyces rouxii TaxID=4956 RepID=A0A1Q3AAS9_ZYGRO|nr:hypothetical protein ZYGR_0AG07010 [Zygosaccharomyces rouxii]